MFDTIIFILGVAFMVYCVIGCRELPRHKSKEGDNWGIAVGFIAATIYFVFSGIMLHYHL